MVVGVLVVLLLATAVFSAGVVFLRSRRSAPDPVGRGLDREQIQGFVVVGSIALAVLGLGVGLLGWVAGRPGPAEALGVLGLMAYLLYLVIAAALVWRTARTTARPRRLHERG